MLVDQLITCKWELCTEWGNMRGTGDSPEYDMSYTETDVDNFVEIMFRKVAEKLDVKYETIKDVLYGRNITFFELKARIFNDYDSLSSSDEDLKKLRAELKIPVTNNLELDSRANRFISEFMELDIQDKIEVLDKFGKIRIKIPGEAYGNAGDFLVQFRELTMADKYIALRQILRADTIFIDED